MNDKFLASYIETALWAISDQDGEPLECFDMMELSPSTLARMQADCAQFERQARALFESTEFCFDDYHVAHDFWLTRNHHGAGFWDGDYPELLATQLTDLAHSFGECELYVGDDQFVHVA